MEKPEENLGYKHKSSENAALGSRGGRWFCFLPSNETPPEFPACCAAFKQSLVAEFRLLGH